jgi:riboflavin biosynthesis pyrimidine reductase
MVSSVDGRATVGGHTRKLGTTADKHLLLELRAIADAVLIGTGTIREEGYARLVGKEERRERRARLGLEEDPPAVLISRSFDIPWEAGLFSSPEQLVLIFTDQPDPQVPSVNADIEVIQLSECTPRLVLEYLYKNRDIKLLLCEGGPRLAGALIRDGLVDELFVTLSPTLVGRELERTMIDGDIFSEPQELTLEWVLEAEGELFLRYRLTTQ